MKLFDRQLKEHRQKIAKNTAKNPKERAMKKKDTYEKFGPSIDTYTMKKAIEDGITVPLVYEGRKVVQYHL